MVEALPLRAWARFFALAVDRLEKAKPGWAAFTVREFLDFELSWKMTAQDRGPLEQEAWMDAAFAELEAVRFGPGQVRNADRLTPRALVWAKARERRGELPDPSRIDPSGTELPPAVRRKLVAGLREMPAEVARAEPRKLSRRRSRTALQAWIDVLDPPRAAGRPRKK